MGWRYCLVDALWDKQIGDEKMAELIAYARTKGVQHPALVQLGRRLEHDAANAARPNADARDGASPSSRACANWASPA